MPIEYGLALVHVTETLVFPVTAAEVNEVPAVDGKVKVAALIVQDAVIVICTVKFAVAVPACASAVVWKLQYIYALHIHTVTQTHRHKHLNMIMSPD